MAKPARTFRVELPCRVGPSGVDEPDVPPGFAAKEFHYVDPAEASSMTRTIDRDLLLSRAWAIAKSPASQLFMWGFYFYMSGSTLGIWSLFVLVPLLSSPIGMLMNLETAFASVSGHKGVDITLPKLLYMGIALIGVGLGLTKVYQFGLLPITSADWVGLLQRLPTSLHAFGMVPLS